MSRSRYLASALLAIGSVVACGSTQKEPKIRAADLEAWEGVPLIELETHPRFSTEHRTVRQLSDGSQQWILSKCYAEKDNTKCSTVNVYGTLQTRCTGGAEGKACCYNQFIVRNGTVASYSVTGDDFCTTHCGLRPASRPCSDRVLN